MAAAAVAGAARQSQTPRLSKILNVVLKCHKILVPLARIAVKKLSKERLGCNASLYVMFQWLTNLLVCVNWNGWILYFGNETMSKNMLILSKDGDFVILDFNLSCLS